MAHLTARASLRTPLLLASGFALANGLWSLFLWRQLLVSRSGGEAYCALGGSCADLWDGAFASHVHALTGIPVAGWGLVWSAAALGLCLLAWNAARSDRDPEPFYSGVSLFALGGALGVVVLVAASALGGRFCGSCAIAYALVAAFAGLAFSMRSQLLPKSLGAGVVPGGVALFLAFVLFLIPGLRTPKAGAQLGAEMLAESAATSSTAGAPADPMRHVRQMMGRLPPAELQHLANVRAEYVAGARVNGPPPRAIVGERMAPVRLTTWTDSGCSHCGSFHDAMMQLERVIPKNSFSIDQRVYPLDSSCNEHIVGTGNDVVCLAAQVRVCLEHDPRAYELAGWLHTDAAPLTPDSVYAVATRLTSREKLDACVASAETREKIQKDVAFGAQAGLKGTPFVLMNGRPAATYIPFLYAMIVARGDVNHPVFDSLPEPTENLHEGHAH